MSLTSGITDGSINPQPFAGHTNWGSIVGSGPRTGELRNPKVGGVYHIASFFDGSPTNECNIVLPLAGAAPPQEVPRRNRL